MNPIRQTALAALLLATLGSAQALTTAHQISFDSNAAPRASTTWSAETWLPQFDSQLGTLDAVTISVAAGLDTDCNGATVGSIVGAAAGKARFRNELAGRLNDTIKPNLIGFQEVTMADLAKRTAIQWQRCQTYWDQRHGRVAKTQQAAGALSA